MAEQTAPSSLKSRVIKTESVDWSSFKYIQHNKFKEWTLEEKSRLRNSILANEFTHPFYVWQEPETTDIYFLGGKIQDHD